MGDSAMTLGQAGVAFAAQPAAAGGSAQPQRVSGEVNWPDAAPWRRGCGQGGSVAGLRFWLDTCSGLWPW